MKQTICSILATLLLTACVTEKENTISHTDQSEPSIYFTYNCSDNGTKVLAIDDNLVSNTNILIYDSAGLLQYHHYCASGTLDAISLRVRKGELYSVYCIANTGDMSAEPCIITKSALDAYRLGISSFESIANSSGAIPMTCSLQPRELNDGDLLTFNLTRCASLVTISIDKSALNNDSFNVVRIMLKNVPSSVNLFSDSKAESAADIFTDGDTTDISDLLLLNSGERIGFYLFENMQGNLLPENTVQSGKCFPSDSKYNNLCTYMEATANYDGSAGQGTVIYRFYIGGDLTSNFDIKRNNQYNLTLIPTLSGFDEDSWRVDKSNLTSLTGIAFSPASKQIYANSSFIIQVYAQQGASSIKIDNSLVSFSSSDPSVCTVSSDGTVTACLENRYSGSSIIQGSYKGFNASMTVNVNAQFYASDPYPFDPTISVGESVDMLIGDFYNNGYIELWDITHLGPDLGPGVVGSAYWFSEDESIVSCTGDGHITGISRGKTKIYARYYYTTTRYNNYMTPITVE